MDLQTMNDKAAQYIIDLTADKDRLKARVAELEAWQTGVCALIQTASMDGQSILPHELTDAIYHP